MVWMIRGVCLWFLLAWVVPFPDELLQAHPQNTRYLDREGRVLRRTLGEGGWMRIGCPWRRAGIGRGRR